MPIPDNYETTVYAGVLGKIIGVYLGRPFEQWKKADIQARWGKIDRYVHEDRNVPLVVADDGEDLVWEDLTEEHGRQMDPLLVSSSVKPK